jgi:hypothetical protein
MEFLDELGVGIQLLFWISLPFTIPVFIGLVIASLCKVGEVSVSLASDLKNKEKVATKRRRRAR